MNMFNHLNTLILVVTLSVKYRVVCEELGKVRIWCKDYEYDKSITVTSLVGHWEGTQLVRHSGYDIEGDYDYGKCIRIFIEEDPHWEWTRELGGTCHLRWHEDNFLRRQGPHMRRLRLHWHEDARSTQYHAYYLQYQNGIWNYSIPGQNNHRNAPCTSFLEPLGKMTVIQAKPELLILTVCQREPPAFYTLVMGRKGVHRPMKRNHLNRLLRRHGLSTARSEYLCAGTKPDSMGTMACLSSLVMILVGRVLMV